ncbi:hypothetical protein ACFY36_06225 [Actinoplanes sp. NPDC000266]
MFAVRSFQIVVVPLPYIEIDSLRRGPGWEPRPAFVQERWALT